MEPNPILSRVRVSGVAVLKLELELDTVGVGFTAAGSAVGFPVASRVSRLLR
jgi:hypothetical protein